MKRIFLLLTALILGCSTLSAQDLIPVCGVTLGQTTIAYVKSKGISAKGEYASQCVKIHDIDFWDHDRDGIVESIYAVRGKNMPAEWKNLGLSWGLSYNEWRDLLCNKLGFAIIGGVDPNIQRWKYGKYMNAGIEAVDYIQGLRLVLKFSYGNSNKEGCTVDSKNSLYSINIDVLKGYGKCGRGVNKNKEVSRYAYFGAMQDGLRAALDTQLGVNKIGFVDENDNMVIAPAFIPSSSVFKKGMAIVGDSAGNYGVIDKNGNVVIPFKYRKDSRCDIYADEGYIVLCGGYGTAEEHNRYMLDYAGDELFVCKNEQDTPKAHRKSIEKIKKFYERRGKSIIASNREAGKYNSVDAQIARAAIEAGERGEKLYAESLAAAERRRQEAADAELRRQEAERLANSFKHYAQQYVEKKINMWQIKGEYEKTSDWQARVNETTRKQKAAELTREAEEKYIAEKSRQIRSTYRIEGAYDADNGTFCINSSKFGQLLVPVPQDYAPEFKAQFASVTKTPKYFIENDGLALAGVDFTMKDGGPTFTYSNSASLNYTVAEVDYNFDPIEIEMSSPTQTRVVGQQTISKTTIRAGNRSDVDSNIPQCSTKRANTLAVIISNENYLKSIPEVPFAINDGEIFAKYCRQTLGIPAENICIYKNATYGNIVSLVEYIQSVALAFNGELELLLYYAGHGAPDDATKEAYLIPVDAQSVSPKICYSLGKLYSELSAIPARQVTVLLDACFSGSTREEKMLSASARGVALRPKVEKPAGNLLIFSAASGDETAYPYKEQQHGMFTYYLLKKLQESGGEVTCGEMAEYIGNSVVRQSLLINHKQQTPSVVTGITLDENWKSRRF